MTCHCTSCLHDSTSPVQAKCSQPFRILSSRSHAYMNAWYMPYLCVHLSRDTERSGPRLADCGTRREVDRWYTKILKNFESWGTFSYIFKACYIIGVSARTTEFRKSNTHTWKHRRRIHKILHPIGLYTIHQAVAVRWTETYLHCNVSRSPGWKQYKFLKVQLRSKEHLVVQVQTELELSIDMSRIKGYPPYVLQTWWLLISPFAPATTCHSFKHLFNSFVSCGWDFDMNYLLWRGTSRVQAFARLQALSI